jgi:hypothetical protein
MIKKEEDKNIYGAVLLQLQDNYLIDGDINTENNYPGTITFLDKEDFDNNLIVCSKYGVTVGINKRQFNIIEEELKDNKVFNVKMLKFIPAIKGTGTLSSDYDDLESVVISASLNGVAYKAFVQDDVRLGVKK